jgi:hypothetical protein
LKVEALEKDRRVLGIDHLDTVVAAANLAVTYCAHFKVDRVRLRS